MDHVSSIASLAATRQLLGLKPPIIYAPGSKVAAIEKYIEAASVLDENTIMCEVRPINPGEEVQFSSGLFVRAFKTCHTVVSQGYTLFTRKQKLRKEYLGLAGSTLASHGWST